jgi:hypothetical protein
MNEGARVTFGAWQPPTPNDSSQVTQRVSSISSLTSLEAREKYPRFSNSNEEDLCHHEMESLGGVWSTCLYFPSIKTTDIEVATQTLADP